MSPILSFLLALTALLPQALSLSLPANPAAGLTNIINADAGDNPLPPPPPGWYHIPDTSLTIKLLPPFGRLILSANDALNCLTAAQTEISDTIAAQGGHDGPIPRSSWSFVDSNVHLSARPIFGSLGTYAQLSSALTGLRYLITEPAGPGARQLQWVLADDVQGIVMKGEMGPERGVQLQGTGTASASGGGTVATATATATSTQSVSIVGVKELDSS